MQIQKTKLAIAIGSLGLFMGAAQVANAGLVEVNVGAKVSTFSTDISGQGSDNQPFFAPDVRWTPGENIGELSSVRFNLGGQDGNPARFTTNPIDVNNFVLVARTAVAGAYTAAPTLTLTVANAAVTAAQASIINAADAASLSTAAQRLAAINAAVANLATAGVTNLSAATAGEQTAAATAAAAALNAAEPLSVATGIVTALVAVNDAASVAAFPVTAVANTVIAGSYTNGDSALWVDATGAAFGRIFQTTTAGGVNSFDVTVRVNVPLVGDANGDSDAALTGDSVVLSLNNGKYINSSNAAVPFATGALLDTNVDVTNLKAQGFDGTTIAGYPASGTINVIVSVQQGGLTRDAGNTGNQNKTLFAASANPLQFIGYAGNAGATASASFPTTVNLAAEEKKFSHNAGVATWFANGLDLPAASDFFNHIGSFRFDIAALSGAAVKQYNDWGVTGNVNYGQVSDPIGNQYALTAGDTISLTVGVVDNLPNALKPFTAAGGYFLRSGLGDCTAVSGSGDINLSIDVATGKASNPAANLISGTTYTVCARANGVDEIVPHVANVTATLQNIEPTYQDPTFPAQTLGTWVRNGCDATFFNVPGNGPTASGVDKAFLRFTNTTAASTAGTIRAKVWGQDGRLVGTGKLLATAGTAGKTGTLSGHQTGVYNAHDVARAIGTVVADDAANAFPGERVRVVLSGGFSTCEGQNLISTPNGTASNVTTTTNANTNSINTTDRARFNGNNSN
jgi:hypothetical protein